MSNSLAQLQALQKMAQAQKAKELQRDTAAVSAESAKSEPAQGPVESVKPVQTGNGLAALKALQNRTTQTVTTATASQVVVTESAQTSLPPTPPVESVPATLSMEIIAGISDAGLPAQDLTAGIRADLDRLDALLVRDTGINAFNIDDCRSLIMRIMPELKKNPMYVGLVIDRDVHNIMTFCMATQQTAVIENTVKKSAAVKAGGKAAKKNAMAAALGNMSIPGIDDISL